MDSTKVLTDMPIYCKGCYNRNTWVRNPDRDIRFESGKVFELAWKCSKCGATTLTPTDETILKLTREEFDTNKNVIKAREFGFDFNYDTYVKAFEWWYKQTIIQQSEYLADYKMKYLEPNMTITFNGEMFKIYVMYELYSEGVN
jgi:hypothetical protein